MAIAEIMSTDLVTVDMDASLHEVKRLMEAHGFHHLLVVDHGRLAGVISDRDVLEAISPFIGSTFMERGQDSRTLEKRAHQIMSRNPITVTADDLSQRAADLLIENGINAVPVVDEQRRPIGIVTWRDLLPHAPIAA